MLGHYLLTLTPEQEDRVLTTHMRPGGYTEQGLGLPGFAGDPLAKVGPCLVGVACDAPRLTGTGKPWYWLAVKPRRKGEWDIEDQYDGLCQRFGAARVNRVIRDRIITNRLWRELRQSITALSPAGVLEATHGRNT